LERRIRDAPVKHIQRQLDDVDSRICHCCRELFSGVDRSAKMLDSRPNEFRGQRNAGITRIQDYIGLMEIHNTDKRSLQSL
jgi:hypothetical protein